MMTVCYFVDYSCACVLKGLRQYPMHEGTSSVVDEFDDHCEMPDASIFATAAEAIAHKRRLAAADPHFAERLRVRAESIARDPGHYWPDDAS